MKLIFIYATLFMSVLVAFSCTKDNSPAPAQNPPQDTTSTPPADTAIAPPTDTTTMPPKDTIPAPVRKYITMVVSTAFIATDDSASFVEELFSDGYTDYMGLTTTKGSNVTQRLVNPGTEEPVVTWKNSRWELLYPNHTTRSFLEYAPLDDTSKYIHQEVIIDNTVYEVFPEATFTVQGLTLGPDNNKFKDVMGTNTARDGQTIKYQAQ